MRPFNRIVPVDFSRPWWHLITDQKGLALIVTISGALRDLFWVFMPFMITFLFEQAQWQWLYAFAGLWVFALINIIIFQEANQRFQLRAIHSVGYNAHAHLLTIDPQYHVKRSSGQILTKIERAMRGYEDVLDQITFAFVPITISIISMLMILASYSLWLTAAICLCLISMIAYGYYCARYTCRAHEKAFIISDDTFKSTAFENLSQLPLIRATFATNAAQNKLKQDTINNSKAEHRLWMSYGNVSRTLNVMYGISIIILSAYFMHSIQQKAIAVSYAISILLAYIQCTVQLIKIFQPLRRYLRGMTAINDLFIFMQHFGKQTIPINELTPYMAPKLTTSSLVADNVSFAYEQTAIFTNITFRLTCPPTQDNKLYGIIGPSGIGKTTLLAMLGGQLKPTSGTICINDTNIYAVGDTTRRELIALQGQTASSVKGTVRQNLLLGLPKTHGYTDAYLTEILNKIGLMPIFDNLQGLDTMLGEGALNISGGQRQRLNFAALYIRARFYHPAVILIDEPTSSLDEISEMAITAMIGELAHDAITLVIAHRLKTVHDAAGLIDVSLATPNSCLQPYSPQELIELSGYYKRLLDGHVDL